MLDLKRSSPAVIPVSGTALVVASFRRLGPPSSTFAAMVKSTGDAAEFGE